LSLPAALIAMALSHPLAHVMFERGAFTPENTATVAWLQAAYFAQLPAFAVSVLLVRLAAALGQARLILVMAVLSLVLKLALNYAFMQKGGAFGIAAATMPTTAIAAAFLYWSLTRRGRLALPVRA
jgi:putative peptidoglycan lipid II flippase